MAVAGSSICAGHPPGAVCVAPLPPSRRHGHAECLCLMPRCTFTRIIRISFSNSHTFLVVEAHPASGWLSSLWACAIASPQKAAEFGRSASPSGRPLFGNGFWRRAREHPADWAKVYVFFLKIILFLKFSPLLNPVFSANEAIDWPAYSTVWPLPNCRRQSSEDESLGPVQPGRKWRARNSFFGGYPLFINFFS